MNKLKQRDCPYGAAITRKEMVYRRSHNDNGFSFSRRKARPYSPQADETVTARLPGWNKGILRNTRLRSGCREKEKSFMIPANTTATTH